MLPHYPALTLALLLATPVLAQIEPTSPARQRAANRLALREASRTEAPYKESHLAVTWQQLQRGSSAAIMPATNEPRFGRDGLPRVSEPKFPGLRRRKQTAGAAQ